MRIDYLGFEAFVAIADFGSFKKAANHLNLSQTALSHRIHKIEEDLGLQLLVRTTREVSLTKSGQALLPQVRHHLSELSQLYGGALRQGRQSRQLLSFACVPTIAGYYLPGILAQFVDQFPRLMIQLHDQPVDRVIELVQSGEVEFGVSIAGASHWNLDVRALGSEPYVLLVRRDHPLASRGSVTRDDLIGQPFARIRTQHTNRKLVDDALGEFSDRLLWRYEVQNAATAMALVGAGLAVTVLPKLTANLAEGKLVALEFSDIHVSRPLGIFTRRGVPLSEPGAVLVDLIASRLSRI